jgi:hypothetical protein
VHGDVDAAFDAVFGAANAEGGISALPQTLLEVSELQPWQAALASSLLLSTDLLGLLSAPSIALGHHGSGVYGLFVSEEQRGAAAAAALRVLDPNHSRNTWLSASKLAGSSAAVGTFLYFCCQLHNLIMRTSRRTSPVLLSAYMSLLERLLPAALEDSSSSMATTGKLSNCASPNLIIRAFWLFLHL